MPINEYLKQIKKRYAAGISTEHSYRAAQLPGRVYTLDKVNLISIICQCSYAALKNYFPN